MNNNPLMLIGTGSLESQVERLNEVIQRLWNEKNRLEQRVATLTRLNGGNDSERVKSALRMSDGYVMPIHDEDYVVYETEAGLPVYIDHRDV